MIINGKLILRKQEDRILTTKLLMFGLKNEINVKTITY